MERQTRSMTRTSKAFRNAAGERKVYIMMKQGKYIQENTGAVVQVHHNITTSEMDNGERLLAIILYMQICKRHRTTQYKSRPVCLWDNAQHVCR